MATKTKQQKALKTVILISGIGLLLVILAFGGMEATSTPNFCSTCHQIQPAVQAWSQNAHSDVTCLKCHADPGTLGYVKRKIGGLGEVYKQVTNSYDPNNIKAKFNTATCITCHTGELAKDYPKAKNISLEAGSSPMAPPQSHKEILEQDINCLGCHATVAHGDQSKVAQK